MSASQHPVALRLESYGSVATRLLALVMGLPLIDGIFPALVLTGALDTVAGIIQVGLLVFGGSATVAVLLAEMNDSPRTAAKHVLVVGSGIIVLAGLEAAFAPAIKSILNLEIFTRFAALVIAAIAAKTASAQIGTYLPSPGTIIALGFVASLELSNPAVMMVPDFELVIRGMAAAGVGVVFALTVALTAPHLRQIIDIDRFRFGSAVALGMLALSIVSVAPASAPLPVLVVSGLLAVTPTKHQPGGSVDSISEGQETAETPSEPVDWNKDTHKDEGVTNDSSEESSLDTERTQTDEPPRRPPWM